MKKRFWTEKENKYLLQHYANTENEVLAKKLNRSLGSINSRGSMLNLRKSKAFWKRVGGEYAKQCAHTRFKKGHISHNKGKKREEFMTPEGMLIVEKTQFKKGQLPHNAKGPDYVTIRYEKGTPYKYKKDDQGQLRPAHRILWEEHHGTIPADVVIVFKNKNTLDIRLDNLMALTRREHLHRNYHQYPNNIKRAIKLKTKIENQLKK